MPDDGPDEEPVVRDLSPPGDSSLAQVEVNLVIGRGDGIQLVVSKAIQLELWEKLERRGKVGFLAN